ncbi:MAG TPA: hypothetical protein PLO13_05995, partial [Anaerolineaceae bacterium]|nr:hypothetical protein [Anaerolineaceae bacterium]
VGVREGTLIALEDISSDLRKSRIEPRKNTRGRPLLIVPVSAPSTESDRQVSNQSIKRQIAAQKSSR